MAAMQIDGGVLGAAQIDGGAAAAAAGGKGLAAGTDAPFESIAPVTVDEVRVHRIIWRRQERESGKGPSDTRERGRERKIIEREKNERLSRGAALRESERGATSLLVFRRKSFLLFRSNSIFFSFSFRGSRL